MSVVFLIFGSGIFFLCLREFFFLIFFIGAFSKLFLIFYFWLNFLIINNFYIKK